jgi:hypothetical protein
VIEHYSRDRVIETFVDHARGGRRGGQGTAARRAEHVGSGLVLRMLFPRDFKATPDGSMRTSGDHVKVRDYFEHALAHPELDPYIYFTPRSVLETSDVWEGVPAERIVRDLDVSRYDLFFVTGKEWKLLPRGIEGGRLIQFVQSIRQCDPAHHLFHYFKRPAHRICTSDAVAAAAAPDVREEAVVIANGIPLDIFRPGETRRERSVLVWGRKNPERRRACVTRLPNAGSPSIC